MSRPNINDVLTEFRKKNGMRLIQAADGVLYAQWMYKGKSVLEPFESRPVKDCFRNAFRRIMGYPPQKHELEGMTADFREEIVENSEKEQVFIRVGRFEGAIYLDNVSPKGEQVIITPKGWKIIERGPALFYSHSKMHPLKKPVASDDTVGALKKLKQIINVCKSDFMMIVFWAIALLKPEGPFPPLFITGEPGSSKTLMTWFLRNLLDPVSVSLQGPPREERDIIVSARNNWILAYDNLSGLSNNMSDAFCRLATGTGIGGRKLYTDFEEASFEACRPVVLNGIGSLLHRGDLASRAILVTAKKISQENRMRESELKAKFEKIRPEVLGALLTGVSTAMKNIGKIELPAMTRMADFMAWSVAAAPAFGWKESMVIRAFKNNEAKAMDETFQSDPVAREFIGYVMDQEEEDDTWAVSAGDLLDELNAWIKSQGRNEVLRQPNWPTTPSALSSRLFRALPSLEAKGITIEKGRKNDRRWITIRRTYV